MSMLRLAHVLCVLRLVRRGGGTGRHGLSLSFGLSQLILSCRGRIPSRLLGLGLLPLHSLLLSLHMHPAVVLLLLDALLLLLLGLLPLDVLDNLEPFEPGL